MTLNKKVTSERHKNNGFGIFLIISSNIGLSKERRKTMGNKKVRKDKLCKRKDGRFVFVALDHGMTMGSFGHLNDMENLIKGLDKAGVDGIIVHKGIMQKMLERKITLENAEWIVHLSASTNLNDNCDNKKTVCSVKEAIQLGATGVSIHVNVGTPDESDMLEQFGKISNECNKWGIPLLCMIYDKSKNNAGHQLVRIATEFGADYVKVKYVQDKFEEMSDEYIPILFAGGKSENNLDEYLVHIKTIVDKYGDGVCIGRNIIESDNPQKTAEKICEIVHKNSICKEKNYVN